MRHGVCFFLGAVVFLAGCLQEHHCSSGSGYGPITGARSDFTTAPGELPGCTLFAPATCDGGGNFINIRGTGTRHFVFGAWDGGCARTDGLGRREGGAMDLGAGCGAASFTAFAAELKGALSSTGTKILGTGIGACSTALPGGAYVQIDDWRQADPVVRRVAMQIGAWDLGDSVGVLVQGVTIACPM